MKLRTKRNEDEEPAARERIDLSDPRAEDRLSIEDWMKLRGKQLRKR
jgi:hypothetical protein